MSEKLKVGILGGTGMVGQPQARPTKKQSAADGKWTHPCRKR